MLHRLESFRGVHVAAALVLSLVAVQPIAPAAAAAVSSEEQPIEEAAPSPDADAGESAADPEAAGDPEQASEPAPGPEPAPVDEGAEEPVDEVAEPVPAEGKDAGAGRGAAADAAEPDAEADDVIAPLSVDEVAIAIGYDGTGVFDADSDPGNDSSPTNGIVRTLDTVQYRFQYNSLTDLQDPFITSTLPEGMSWASNDATCVGTGTTPAPSGIYDSVTGEPGGDRRTLVCQLPSADQAISDEILPVARVGVVPNGTVLSVSFTADDASNEPVVSDPVSVTVSAAPFYDLRKIGRSSSRSTAGEDGTTPGVVDGFAFGITVAHPTRSGPVDGVKGMAPLASPITFTDDLSDFSPNAQLWTWGDAGNGCAPILGGGIAAPISAVGAAPGATTTNSVPDSGTIDCAPSAGGFTVTLTGTDTLGTSFPTVTSAGTPVPVNTLYVATGQVYVWYPTSDILDLIDAGGNLRISNTFTDFDPDDVTGQSNYGDGTEALEDCYGRPGEPCNNTYTFNQVAGLGVAQKAYRDYNTGGIPTGASGIRSGDLSVGIGSRVLSDVSVLPRVLPAENVIMCDVFDSSALRLVPAADGPAPARPAQSSGGTVQPGQFVIEYGAPTSRPATFSDARASRCDNADATWSTSPSDPALGGSPSPYGFRDSIDRVRIRFLADLGPEATYTLYTALEVYSLSDMDPALNPDGVIAANFGQVRAGATPSWLANTFNPVTFGGNGLGDRATIAPGIVRIAKALEEAAPGSGTQVLAGQRAVFRLTPSASALGGGVATEMRDVVVTDILPTTSPRLTVDPLTVTQPDGAVVEFCQVCDGSDWSTVADQPTYGVRWSFGDVVTGTPLPVLRIGTLVPLEATNGQSYTNAAVISSPSDPSSEEARTGRAVAVVAAPSTLLATKTTADSIRPLAGELTWTLAFRNASTVDIDALDVIDILPFNSDGRSPASNYSGGWSDVQVTGLPARLDVYVASEDPVALDERDGTRDGVLDPGRASDPWYVPPGTAPWACTLTQVGTAGCPAAGEVTALRFASDEGYELPAASTSSWDVSLSPTGNVSGDQYSNQFTGRTSEAVLQLPVQSPAIPIQVIAPSVDIVKDVCVPGECDLEDTEAWLDVETAELLDPVLFRLTVTNTGPEAGEVTVTDLLPDGLLYVVGFADKGDVDQFPDLWTVGQMEPGETATLVFLTVVIATGEQVNAATAEITDRFDQQDTDRDTATVTVADPTAPNPEPPGPGPVEPEPEPGPSGGGLPPTGGTLQGLLFGIITLLVGAGLLTWESRALMGATRRTPPARTGHT